MQAKAQCLTGMPLDVGSSGEILVYALVGEARKIGFFRNPISFLARRFRQIAGLPVVLDDLAEATFRPFANLCRVGDQRLVLGLPGVSLNRDGFVPRMLLTSSTR